MASDRWQRIESVFNAALTRPSAGRPAFLADACGDDVALRQEVESLLAETDDKAGDFLSISAAVAAAGLLTDSAAPPPVVIGQRLGRYLVVGRLGTGGMGEVYRARDKQLGRDVALKLLPAEVAADRERLARFEREGRALAALNHPHIGAIYGLETPPIGAPALVLELVPGDTLAERLARGPLRIATAVAYARQIADALDAAHERGIVHRDLKPANIKITPDEIVKVLDFGLAKTTTTDPAEQSQALTMEGTRPGVVLGTAAYMSPEQARGLAVDKRTDIWAFGCVLYEMLTGRLAFSGQTMSDTIAAILDREPNWNALPPETRPRIRQLLARCLEKDPKRRLRDIGDVRIELDEGLAAPADQTVVARSSVRRQLLVSWLLVAAASTAAIAFGLLVFRSRPGGAALVDATIERLTYDSGLTTMPALSPDGRLLAYASDRAGRGDLDIWVQQMPGNVPLRLTDDPANDSSPDFSPDGNQVAFRSERGGGGVYVVPALGGVPRLIAPEGRRPRFSPDGSRLAYWTGQFRGSISANPSATFVVSLAGGAPVRVLPEFPVARDPLWAPDGASLLVLGRRDSSSPLDQAFDLWQAPLDGRSPVRTGAFDLPGLRASAVVEAFSLGAWSRSGLLLAERATLRLLPLSPVSGHLTGPARLLALGAGSYANPTASRDGQIAFDIPITERVIERAPLADIRSPKPAIRLYADSRGGYGRASSTRDGSVIVFERGQTPQGEIWWKNILTGEQRLVLSVESAVGLALNATVSPDGARIAYTIPDAQEAARGATAGRAYVVETSGGVPRSLCERCSAFGFLSDNRRAITTTDAAIRLIDIATGAAQDVISNSGGGLDRPNPSPNDRWLAFRQTVGTTGNIFVAAMTPGHPLPRQAWAQVEDSKTTGRPAGWSPDSRILYLLLDTDGFRCLYGQRVDGVTGRLIGTPEVIRHFHVTLQLGFGTSYGNAITPDGFTYEGLAATGNIWRLLAPGAAGR